MIVLDTHVLIWAIQNDRRLGGAAITCVEDAVSTTGLMIPAICAWEIAQIGKRQKIPFVGGALHWFETILAEPGFNLTPLDPRIAIASVRLEWSHKDPSDRIIVATAQHLNAPLLTADEKILTYAAAGHLQAIDARR